MNYNINENQNIKKGKKMTRQQRRKIERDRKKNGVNTPIDFNTMIYGSTIVHWESLVKTGNTLGYYISPEDIQRVKKTDFVGESVFLVDVENRGVTTPSIVRIIHNSERSSYNPELSQELLMLGLTEMIQSSKNESRETLNDNTKFSVVMCSSSEIDSRVLEQLDVYVKESINNDFGHLKQLYREFKKVG